MSLAARVERATAENTYRFAATRAYDAVVTQRIAETFPAVMEEDLWALERQQQSAGVVVDVKPVTHVGAIAVDGQRLAFEAIENH